MYTFTSFSIHLFPSFWTLCFFMFTFGPFLSDILTVVVMMQQPRTGPSKLLPGRGRLLFGAPLGGPRGAVGSLLRGRFLDLLFSLPPLWGRVLLRPPQRHLGGGQSGGAAFGSGFCPAPLKIHRNLQISWISVKFPEIPAKFLIFS